MSMDDTASELAVREATRKRLKIIFDLDGTLADIEHRTHFLQREKKDWRAFYAACDKDEPKWQAIRVLQALFVTGADIEIWTGRSREVEEKTKDWLSANGLGPIPLKMREEGDHRPDTTVKEEWLKQASYRPSLVFEDRASVVAMWRSHGVTCFQVAEGDF